MHEQPYEPHMNTNTHLKTHTHTHQCLYQLLYPRVTQTLLLSRNPPPALDSSLWHSTGELFENFNTFKPLPFHILLTADNDLAWNKYFIVKTGALRHELPVTFLPPIFTLSFCVFLLVSQLSLPLHTVRLPPSLVPFSKHLSLHIPSSTFEWPALPQLFLSVLNMLK